MSRLGRQLGGCAGGPTPPDGAPTRALLRNGCKHTYSPRPVTRNASLEAVSRVPCSKAGGAPLLGQVTGREGLGAGPVGAAGTAPSQEPSHDQPARSAQIYRKAPHPHRAGCWRRPRPALMSCCPGPRPRGPLPWRCPAPGCGQDDHEPVRVTTEWPPVAHLGRGSTPRWLRTWTD